MMTEGGVPCFCTGVSPSTVKLFLAPSHRLNAPRAIGRRPRSRKSDVARARMMTPIGDGGGGGGSWNPVAQALVGPLFETLNKASPEWLRTVVWLDFRLAVALFVFYPLALFIGSFGESNDALKRVMVGYWQASSLLMLTVLLNIGEQPFGTFTGMFVQIMVPITIWWWKDLLSEIETQETALAKAFRLWRWPATTLSVLGGITQLTLQRCNFVPSLLSDEFCAAWLEPPFRFKELLLPFASAESLTWIAYAGVLIYFSYLLYYVAVPLPRIGRLGRKERDCFTSISILKGWGWISSNGSENEGTKI